MTAPLLAALALAASAADPCAPVAPLAEDAAAAAAYRDVGDAEAAAGRAGTAAVAYRAAAARDPRDAASRAALARLCADGAPADPFQAAVARLDAGRPAEALALLRSLHRGAAPEPAVALLEGIALLDLGADAEAEPLLRRAAAAPAHAPAAELYLGLLRLRAGGGSEAVALFDRAAATPALAPIAEDLARLARRDGRLVLSVLAESGWDSNVTLAPATPAPGPEADAALGLGAAVLYRPRGTSGPYLRASAGATEHLSLAAYDFAALDGAAGWQHRRGALTLGAELALGARTLGGEPYLLARRLLVSGALALRGATVSAAYAARSEDYAAAYAGYSGILHRAELRVALPLGDAARVGLAYGLARDATRTADLSYVEHGPRADLRLALGRRARLALEAGLALRRYDARDTALGVLREDVQLDAAATAELDLSDHLTARAGLVARTLDSTLDALGYEKLVPTVGLVWTRGL